MLNNSEQPHLQLVAAHHCAGWSQKNKWLLSRKGKTKVGCTVSRATAIHGMLLEGWNTVSEKGMQI